MDIIRPNENIAAEKEHNESADATPPSSTTMRDMNFISLKGFFNIDTPTPEEESAMNYIFEFFDRMEARSMGEILMGIRNIENRLGAVGIGQSRLTATKNYITTLSQIADLNDIKKSMERL